MWYSIYFRHTNENYTKINNHGAQNQGLSLQAKGLLWVLTANKDTWRPYIDEIAKRSKNGRDAHRTAFDELKEAGYIRNYRKSFGRGKGVQNFPLISDIPITELFWEYWTRSVDEELSAMEDDF
ncbi:helix-turn-helix domain-containing protein [Streptococcus danieliae]|uniref:helix-turn-helix domain-containing protein n=1 Tax=Streptococcus danieliae TaxID=747656 RepID=UPI0021C83897|nr:helix-turn-helix domain-containing protein [Streptococcus danieliae]MCU0082232.1 helix-turn-helix domain-containing protein [Streptococcus danieliae]